MTSHPRDGHPGDDDPGLLERQLREAIRRSDPTALYRCAESLARIGEGGLVYRAASYLAKRSEEAGPEPGDEEARWTERTAIASEIAQHAANLAAMLTPICVVRGDCRTCAETCRWPEELAGDEVLALYIRALRRWYPIAWSHWLWSTGEWEVANRTGYGMITELRATKAHRVRCTNRGETHAQEALPKLPRVPSRREVERAG